MQLPHAISIPTRENILIQDRRHYKNKIRKQEFVRIKLQLDNFIFCTLFDDIMSNLHVGSCCCFSIKDSFHQRLSTIEGSLSLKVFFHQRLLSFKDCLQSCKGSLPLIFVFHPTSYSINICFPLKVVIPYRGCHPLMVIFNGMLPSI